MSEPIRMEIIERAKAAAVSHGRRRGTEGLEPVMGKSEFVLYTLELSGPKLGELRVFWIPSQTNLRIRLHIPELGHWGSKSVVDINCNVGSRRAKKPIWHYTERNGEILAALQRYTVLNDLADI